jgi:multidrug efflux system membrane fusion protein
MKAINALFLLCILVAVGACSEKPDSGRGPQAPGVTAAVSVVAVTPVTEEIRLPGTVRGAQTAVLISHGGGQVTRVAVEAGDTVKAGDVLVEVDTGDARAALAQAQAQLTQAQADWRQAQADEKRYSILLKQGAITKRDYELVKQRYDATRAADQAARRNLAAARERLGYAVVRAPFSGLVTERRVDPGDIVPAGNALMTVAGGHPEVRVYAGESVFAGIHADTPVRVTVDGRDQDAAITQLVSAADPVTHSHLIKLALPDDAPVAVGAYAVAVFSTAVTPAVTVPTSALVSRAGITGVFMVDDHDTAHFREVRTGNSKDDATVIAAGLSAGERIVTRPTPDIGNGTPIQVVRDHD